MKHAFLFFLILISHRSKASTKGSKNEEIHDPIETLNNRLQEFVARKKIMTPAAGASLWLNALEDPKIRRLIYLVQIVIDEFNGKSRQKNNSSPLWGGRGKNLLDWHIN